MKFSCTHDNLQSALGVVAGVAGKHINLPILGNVLLRVDAQKVSLTATNLEIALSTSFRAKVDAPGTFTVPAKTFTETVGFLTDGPVTIELDGSELVIQAGKTRTKLKGTSAEEFPIIPELQTGRKLTVPKELLKDAFTRVLPAVARTEIRPELSGVYFGVGVHERKGITLAATDSFRLAERVIPLNLPEGEVPWSVIVPGKTAQEVTRLLSASEGESAELTLTETQLAVVVGETVLISRLVEGSYPDYTQIIPRQFSTTVTCAADALGKEVKAAGIFTTSGINAVEVTFAPGTGVMQFASASTQAGEYRSELPVEGTGVDVKVLLSHRYLLDGLSALRSPRAQFSVVNADSPCVLSSPEGDGFLYIIMPIRQ